MAHLLGGEHLHVEFPAKVVLDDVTVGIDGGDRIGIVGRNGDGKSTLMKVLTGRMDPDEGRVTLRGGVRVGMLAQDDDLPEDEREIFDLLRIQGLTQPEAAEVLGVSVKTVQRWLNRSLLLLAKELDDLRPI